MSRSWWGRFSLLVGCVLLAVAYLYPTLARLDLEKTKFPIKEKMNLGLDLQGGVYLVLGVDFQKVYREIVQRQIVSLEARFKEKNFTHQETLKPSEVSSGEDPQFDLHYDAVHRDEVRALLKKEFPHLRFTGESSEKFHMGLSHDYKQEVRERTLSQSIEVIRNRIDEFGVTEPVISSQGSDRVVVELPGVKEVDRAKDLMGRTARLEFKIVDDQSMNSVELASLIAQLEKEHHLSYRTGEKFSEYVRQLNEKAKGRIPAEDEIAFERSRSAEGDSEGGGRIPYLLHSKAEVTGNDLQDASVQLNPENRMPTVSFVLNPRGSMLFETVSGEHVGQRLAIVLDNTVHSAPVIQGKIAGGHGQITLGRGDSDAMMKEAKDLAIVLRAGALPAQLDFLEQRVVGPSLGGDSIQKGAFASLIGSLLVFLFVIFYYRVSGAIAVFSLLLNVLFVLALLVGVGATLTLPGIAGIALTVGIAVDSNVVIYERIREELRAGKRVVAAVEAGFQKAFRTILDANVTNAAAAIVLWMYGTGAIKGFAVTLLIGIGTTLFTAVFVCRLVFELYLKYLATGTQGKGSRTLSI